MGRVGIHHSTTMVSSGSFCFLVVLVPVLGVPLPTPDPLNVHIHLDDVMKKDMESAGKSEEPGEDYGDHGNYPVVPDEKPVHYGEAEHGNEMNIGSIGNVLGNVNDGTNGNSMHGSNMFSGGGSFGNTMFSGGGSLGGGNIMFHGFESDKTEQGNEMNIGSIGNVLGNVNDGTNGNSMHGSNMFSGGGSFGRGNQFSMHSGSLGGFNSIRASLGEGNGIFEDKMKMED